MPWLSLLFDQVASGVLNYRTAYVSHSPKGSLATCVQCSLLRCRMSACSALRLGQAGQGQTTTQTQTQTRTFDPIDLCHHHHYERGFNRFYPLAYSMNFLLSKLTPLVTFVIRTLTPFPRTSDLPRLLTMPIRKPQTLFGRPPEGLHMYKISPSREIFQLTSTCAGEPHTIRSVVGMYNSPFRLSSKRQGKGRNHQAHILFLLHAHLPNNAIRHAPRHISPNAPSTTFSSAFRIELLNINSCAISSTKPV